MGSEELGARLDRLETMIRSLIERQQTKEWYTSEEVGKLLGRSDYTVREWCRQGRIKGEKKGSGRGKYQSWVVSHAEVQRVQREGLLPIPKMEAR